MAEINKNNLLFFEGASMRELYHCMETWQIDNQKHLLSTNIQKDGDMFCCISLTNTSEVVITSLDGKRHAKVSESGSLYTL